MIFKLLFLLLLVGVAFFQSTQGLFSALIMMVLALSCAAGAIGSHEWVAVHWVAPYLRPDYAYSVALAVSFGIPLVLLRLVADKFITRACMLPLWVDRIGGGLCGLVTAFLVVGVMSHAVQNLPFGPSIIGFARVDATNSNALPIDGVEATPPDPDAPQQNLILEPDRIALNVGSMMLAGVFSGTHSFIDDHPDLVQTSAWVNAVPTQVSRFVKPESISIVRTQTVPFVYDFKPAKQSTRRGGGGDSIPATYDPIDPAAGKEFHMVRVKLKNTARDKHSSHIFTLRQFRIVGQNPQQNHMTQYLPIAIQDADSTQTINRHIRKKETNGKDWPVINETLSPRPDNNSEVEIVFELPIGFQPSHLAYKRGAFADVSFDNEAEHEIPDRHNTNAPPPSTANNVAPVKPASNNSNSTRRRGRRKRGNNSTSDAAVPNSGRGGNVRGFTANQGKSFFGSQLPMTLTAYRKLKDVELSGDKLVNGHLYGVVSEQDGGTKPVVDNFDVPDDKRLLQLNTTRLHTRSGLGKALDFASRTVQNYLVEDDRGNKYQMCGKYAITTVNGQRIIEVQYFKDQFGSIGGVGAFDKIKDAHLKKNYELGLLFLVPPGAKIVRFSTGGAATRADDLSGEDLIAPK